MQLQINTYRYIASTTQVIESETVRNFHPKYNSLFEYQNTFILSRRISFPILKFIRNRNFTSIVFWLIHLLIYIFENLKMKYFCIFLSLYLRTRLHLNQAEAYYKYDSMFSIILLHTSSTNLL